MDVPSRHTVAVLLGPTRGVAPTVYLTDSSHALDSRLRQDLSEFLEQKLRSRATLIVPRHSSKLRSAFAAFEFAAGTLPREALELVRKARAWFFQNLLPAEARRRRAHRKAARIAERRERRTARRGFRPMRGAPACF